MIAVLIITYVTYTVKVFVAIRVRGLSVSRNYSMSTRELVPVVSCIVVVYVFTDDRMLAGYVSAFLTNTVVDLTVVVALSFHISGRVSADRGVPVTGFVPTPYVRVEGVVTCTYNVFANVTYTVFLTVCIKLIYVSGYVSDNVVSAGSGMPVLCSVRDPTDIKLVLVIVIP